MKIHRWVRVTLWSLLVVVLLVGMTFGGIYWYFHPAYERSSRIVYAQRHGHDLTLEVIRPKQPNNLGVIFLVSGGWKSDPSAIEPLYVAALLRHGYTVFAVSHLSQPKATVMEIVEDVNRSVRFIRHHAQEYRVKPDQLGVMGGSAGGHLSLMLATRGGPGDPQATDPVDRESSAVQAVAIFFPVTDLLNLGKSTENPGEGGPPIHFVSAFGPQATNLPVWKQIGHNLSPIYYATSNLPPTLILHGDADTLVPLDQSQRFQARAQEMGGHVEVVVFPGKPHGWTTMIWDLRQCADWFDRYLKR